MVVALIGATVYMIAMYVALYGLWKVEPWAWSLSSVLFLIGGVLSLVDFSILGLVYHFGILWYIYSKREYYSKHR
ncbi:Uncharacterized membrane protein, DUF2068 [Natranaeroarchaeum sulfidigenes]|uniref:Uncharacterized membrane protein, DUF2068 n=1 Tax=Natranaeroarchaeum sulfidigenes TaxID=2784880 RepID=A0A897MPN8_9EURY|nr:Uncharacterized membrane protein, DUF2068 [Natranaeroarchaeum sulfidigenes]